jgi:ligand-binding SRPBCC domain-containing protein
MKPFLLERTTLVRRPRSEVFAFFSDAGNLARLTPPELGFEILTPRPIAMQAGTRIDYRIRLFGLPMQWRTRITAWDPPHEFADLQERGPYAWWHHTHRFEEIAEGTRMTDRVEYRLPLGWLGSVGWPLVRLQLRRIFDYRGAAVLRLLDAPAGGNVGRGRINLARPRA